MQRHLSRLHIENYKEATCWTTGIPGLNSLYHGSIHFGKQMP